MIGNESPRLVKILIRLALNWAICKNRSERATKRLRQAGASASEKSDGSPLDRLDEEAKALDAAFHDHPFPGFVRLVSQDGIDRDALHAAALKEFDGEWELVSKLNALDEKGVTATLFQQLRTEYPDIARDLFGADRPEGKNTEDAGQSALAGLLNRAGKVFEFARKLGWEFNQDFDSQRPVFMFGDESPRQRHREKIDEFIAAVLDLGDAVANPPDGSAAVVDQLRKAGRLAKRLSDNNNANILGLFPDLNSVAIDGYEAVKAASNAAQPEDPFAVFDDAPKPAAVEPEAEDASIGEGFIERLLAGPVGAELTPREMVFLEAHLKQAIDFSAVQRERLAHPRGESETWNRHSKLKLIRDFNRNLRDAARAKEQPPLEPLNDAPTDAKPKRRGRRQAKSDVATPKQKRSTERGEGRAKLTAALTKHHKYADGGCLNLEPVGNNELARLANVDQATASTFFKQQFKGHSKYKAVCADAAQLAAALRLLNGEFSPYLLYGAKPPDEAERDEE